MLEIESLRYRYGQRLAVDGATFAIARGELFGLLGPNGAGKSTTLRCIAGLIEPDAGSMRFAGAPFTPATSGADRARIGAVPQEIALYGELTARENLDFFGELHGLSGAPLAAAIDAGLALAGLADRANDRVKSFSGGMKRRLNLAVGNLHAPELLLLDEPTAGVDPQSRNHLFESLLALRAAGRTLLYTTHYMEEAQRLCDRIAIIDAGKLLAIGTASELAAQAGLPGADLEAVFLRLTGRSLRDA
ncbi:MAG: ABC transporter ATP-binding protein [Planctomycetes bacterium]|nr:ABC transporter ATP-binding protein [Planctomycetota bacterium]